MVRIIVSYTCAVNQLSFLSSLGVTIESPEPCHRIHYRLVDVKHNTPLRTRPDVAVSQIVRQFSRLPVALKPGKNSA